MKINLLKTSLPSWLPLMASTLLILLWVYTAASKWADMREFEKQLANQVFGKSFRQFLVWFLPGAEFMTAFLLFFRSTRMLGLYFSLFLLALFSAYIVLILSGYYPRIPCSCGGVLKQLNWWSHLWFNLGWMVICLLGIRSTPQTPRVSTGRYFT